MPCRQDGSLAHQTSRLGWWARTAICQGRRSCRIKKNAVWCAPGLRLLRSLVILGTSYITLHFSPVALRSHIESKLRMFCFCSCAMPASIRGTSLQDDPQPSPLLVPKSRRSRKATAALTPPRATGKLIWAENMMVERDSDSTAR